MCPPSDNSRPPRDPADLQRTAHAPADPPMPPVYRAPASDWRGITWRDVPGHDMAVQKLNFTLLRRGMLKGYDSCKGLEGECLKEELHNLSLRNKKNSKGSYKRHVSPPPPPPPSPRSPPRSRSRPRLRRGSPPPPL